MDNISVRQCCSDSEPAYVKPDNLYKPIMMNEHAPTHPNKKDKYNYTCI